MQIKGLLEMMFDKLAGWIDELILDMEVNIHHTQYVPKRCLLLVSIHAALLGQQASAGISCWQSNLSCACTQARLVADTKGPWACRAWRPLAMAAQPHQPHARERPQAHLQGLMPTQPPFHLCTASQVRAKAPFSPDASTLACMPCTCLW